MANRKVKRLKLDSIIIKKLEKHNVSTCKDVLNKTFLELLKITGVSYSQVNTVLQTASISCAPKPISALDLLQQAEEEAAFMTTSFKQLDEILHGGLPTSSITEIAGPAGCGKTQLSILYCVEALFSASTDGKDASVIYIDTEGAFSAERLVEIAQCRYPDHFSTNEALIHLTNHLFIYLETTCSSLLKRFHSLEEEIIQNRVKLIIVDSIASLVRKEFDSSLSGNFIHRSNILGKQAIHLKYLAKSFNIP
ncbi:DNA repair protein RAD51 homolog 2-like, partial [Saccoglossus kowalevskii]